MRKVFFSFHYGNDVWRANQVRNSWVTKERSAAGFIDSADFEKIEKEGEQAIKDWIVEQLKGTSVTVVLIGNETSNRKYVKYEIEKSFEKGNGIVGVYIHNLKNQDGKTSIKGSTIFRELGTVYRVYDYVNDNGYDNLGNWIEEAAKNAGK